MLIQTQTIIINGFMKWFCIFIGCLLFSTLQVFGQDPDESSLEGQNKMSQIVNERTVRTGVKISPKPKEEQQTQENSVYSDTIHPKQESCDSLLSKNQELDSIIKAYKVVYGGDEYVKGLIKDPLKKACNPVQIGYHKELIELYKESGLNNDVKRVYEVYFPLLNYYEVYNNEIIGFIRKVVESFDSNPNKELERDAFNQSLRDCRYYKEFRYKNSVNQEIVYLEDVINDTKALFEDPSKFTKENFEAQLKKLIE